MGANQIIEIFLSCVGTLLLIIGSRIANDLRRLTDSVESLNIKMAVICEKVDAHESRLEQLESRR